MEITFAPRGVLQIDGAVIRKSNFSGRPDDYNREGDRNFLWVIPTVELYERLKEDGWPVKMSDPREEGDLPFMFLPVKIKYFDNGDGPTVIFVSGNSRRLLTEETIGLLDNIEIEHIEMDIEPRRWTWNNKSGVTARLKGMEVTQKLDRFAARFTNFDPEGIDG